MANKSIYTKYIARNVIISFLVGFTIAPLLLLTLLEFIIVNLPHSEIVSLQNNFWGSFLIIYRQELIFWPLMISILFVIIGGLIDFQRIKALKNLTIASQNEKKFKELFERSIDSICIIDGNGRFVDCNDSALHFMEIEKKNLIGKRILDFVHEDDREKSAKYLDMLSSHGSYEGYEGRLRVPSGKIKHVQVNSTGLFDGDKLIGSLDIVRDISAKKIEEQKLKEAIAIKEKIFTIIAHDLRSPFNSLLGFSELINKEYDSLSGEEKKSIVESIGNISQETFNLLDNLLTWSRSQTDMIDYRKETCSLYSLIDDTIKLQQSIAYEKGIEINNSVDPEIYLCVDKNMIKTAVRNIISNAIKFTANGGFINLSNTANNTFAILKIEDNGLGMEEETLNSLFQISTNEKTGTHKDSGSGLGLILSKELIEKNGGNIKVESKIGKGSKFEVTLPLAN